MVSDKMTVGLVTLGVCAASIVYYKNKKWIDQTFAKNCRRIKDLSSYFLENRKAHYPDKVLLYFDVNKTLTRLDGTKTTVDGKPWNGHQVIADALAEKTMHAWNGKDEQSYKDFVYQEIPGDKESLSIKSQRQARIFGFSEWLQQQNLPSKLKEDVRNEQTRMIRTYQNEKTNEIKFTVYPSFYKLLTKLRKMQIQFTVILCTFGTDLKDVTEEIAAHPSGVAFTRYGEFSETGSLHLKDGKVIEKTEEIYHTLIRSNEHFACRNNRKAWVQDQERSRSAKPFIFDSQGKIHAVRNVSVFFDDNVTFNKEKDIVSPRNISYPQFSPHDLKDRLVFQVDPNEAETNSEYYIELTNKAFMSQGFSTIVESRL